MKSLTDLLRDISNARKSVQQIVDAAPRVIGTIAVKEVKNNFIISAYDSGNGITPWAKRKAATNAAYDRGKTISKRTGKLSRYRTGKNGTYKGSVYSSANPLLRQTLALFNAIQYKAGKRYVFIGVSLTLVPYAIAHNQGINHQPKRQFMPYGNQPANPKIINAVKRRMDYDLSKALRTFRR